MPDIKITELPVASTLSDSDELIVQQSDGTKRATLSDLPAGVPDGGTQGQVLTKQSSEDGDADWEDIQALPSGGTTGQYLVKSSATEGDADWQTKEVELTQAQYDALPSSKLTDGVSYYITDGESAPSTNRFSASGISYDNTNSGLSATNVQSAIDEIGTLQSLSATLNAKLTNVDINSVYVYGNIAVINIRAQATTAISGSENLFVLPNNLVGVEFSTIFDVSTSRYGNEGNSKVFGYMIAGQSRFITNPIPINTWVHFYKTIIVR